MKPVCPECQNNLVIDEHNIGRCSKHGPMMVPKASVDFEKGRFELGFFRDPKNPRQLNVKLITKVDSYPYTTEIQFDFDRKHTATVMRQFFEAAEKVLKDDH